MLTSDRGKEAARRFGADAVGIGSLDRFAGTAPERDPRFGPFQRFAFILTEAELEADAVASPTLCNRCGACVAACPGTALSDNGDLDEWQCAAYRMGADSKSNLFLDPEAVKSMPDGAEVVSGTKHFDEAAIERWKPLWNEAYSQVRFGYNPSLCGLACQRACLAQLEKRGALQDKFVTPFREA